jgi:small subunit ribosomal protein S9
MANAYYGTGRRKSAIARVWVKEGKGEITINGKTPEEYLCRELLIQQVWAPLKAIGLSDRMDVKALVKGGGVSSQAGAVRHGIARALVAYDEEYRVPLKKAGYLTRDPRSKERKHPGCHRARRGKQFSKR